MGWTAVEATTANGEGTRLGRCQQTTSYKRLVARCLPSSSGLSGDPPLARNDAVQGQGKAFSACASTADTQSTIAVVFGVIARAFGNTACTGIAATLQSVSTRLIKPARIGYIKAMLARHAMPPPPMTLSGTPLLSSAVT